MVSTFSDDMIWLKSSDARRTCIHNKCKTKGRPWGDGVQVWLCKKVQWFLGCVGCRGCSCEVCCLRRAACFLHAPKPRPYCSRAVLADPVKAPLGTDAPCLPITSSPVLLARPALPRQLADAKACQNRKEALMLLDCRCFM